MNNQSIAELLKNVNTSYLTEAERYDAIARAERAEYIVACITSGVEAAKKALLKLKAFVAASSVRHA
jgi:hypothetical protein